jgi:predicted N-acyltransferase
VEVVHSIHDIPAATWDGLANIQGFNPFVTHAFFRALEDSGSTSAKAGWKAHHVVVKNTDGAIVGVAPAFLKSHSQGEYVFDHGWATAFQRAGGRYYPKLQTSVPFTPVTGPRLFARDPAGRAMVAEALIAASAAARASSAHITFLPEADWLMLSGRRFLARQDIQFHWFNNGYTSFDDFLARLSSQKRKNIRKERRAVHAEGVEFLWLTGSDLKEEHWDAFFGFYMDTGSRKWGSPYLNRAFFSLMSATLSPHVLLVLARHHGRYIAGALNLIGDDALYGRNWGTTSHLPFLHFETCYYQAIDFAISRKLARVEAGAQGEHKLARGYLPVKTFSLHHLAHDGLAKAVSDYLEEERRAVDRDQAALAAHAPFRHDSDD